MEKAIFCLVVVLLSLTVAALAKKNDVDSFLLFKATHNKEYTSPVEETYRFEIFQENILLAEQLNRELNTTVFGVEGPFADMTREEFAETYLMNPSVSAQEAARVYSQGTSQLYDPWEEEEELVEIPPEGVKTFDWKTVVPSAITPVKNQKHCGSCWAFAATETLESQWIINGNSPVVLAPQQYVDCTYKQNGCNGGAAEDAWKSAMANGQALEASYPYTASYSGSCKFNPSTGVVKPTGIVAIGNRTALLNYVTKVGPAAVYVDANHWHLYTGGVFPAQKCNTYIDHVVVVNGYHSVGGQNVWWVRNSWGAGWGNKGYIEIPFGACYLESYPVGVKTAQGKLSRTRSPVLSPSRSPASRSRTPASRSPSRAPSKSPMA